MRWIVISCFLLASAHDIVSTARPKRDLWSIKNLISSKLFGTDTVVIQLPKIPKNETYQLFRIKGYDNVFLKVNRKPEKEKVIERPVNVKYEDPVMVSPEIAIIGNYLGTTTHRETLLALEIANNLLKSGILRNEKESVQEPMAPQGFYKEYIVRNPVKSVGVITKERDPIYIDPSVIESETIVNRHPVAVYPAEYPPMVIASEEKYRPFQTRYSYKQETEDADMTYESYNNREVLVKRTNKVPVKPRYITVRLADVVSIAAKPHLIRSQQPIMSTGMPEDNLKEPLKVVPIHSYVMEKIPQVTPSPEVTEESEYVDNNNDPPGTFDINPPIYSETLDVPNFVEQSKLPFDIREHLTDGEIDQLNKFINAKLDLSKNNGDIFTPRPYYSDEEINSDDQKASAGGYAGPINTGKIVSRYSYKQMGDESHNNYTVVRIEDPKPNKNEINIFESDGNIPKNYVYVPPNIAVLPPVPNKNNINERSTQNKYEDYENFSGDPEINPRTSVPITLRGDLRQTEVATEKPKKLKTNGQHYLTNNPIIVAPETENKQIKVTTHKGGIKTTSGRPYTGGHRINTTIRTSSTRSYTRGSENKNG